VLKVRVFRPFPFADIAEALAGCKAVAVLDRAESFGAEGGPLFLEVRSALYDREVRPAMTNYIYGLGGSDVKLELMRQVYSDLSDIADGVQQPGRLVYLGTR
jgi:pyruvate ferredoxin oxidoreductase alpha subunit